VFARSGTTHHQVVGLPPAMLTMRTPAGTPPVAVPAATTERLGPPGAG
jgi:hypothetical protein